MAMLAETRKKQKWTLNPRGSAWAKDSSKFGEKLLRKMGWSDGQGLGAQKQGITEHIKVQVKHDSKGLGFKDNDQVWVEVENDFANLLSKLSSKKGEMEADTSTSKIPVEVISQSLEEQSKKSKTRVHYQKFTRGKDLSRYSKRDLECIFGMSSKTAESKHEENKNFVPSGNMKEYFSKKTIQKSNKLESESCFSSTQEVDNPELNDNSNEIQGDVPKKKKKKGKKRKLEDTELCEYSTQDDEEQEVENKFIETTREKTDSIVKNKEKVKSKKSKMNKGPLEITKEDNVYKKKDKKHDKKKKSKSEPVVPQLDGTYDSSEVEEFGVNPLKYLDSNCLANIEVETVKAEIPTQQITQKRSSYTSNNKKLRKQTRVIEEVKSAIEASLLRNDQTVQNLSKKNEDISKQIDGIVQAKINNYLSQVFNRKEKIVNPAREMKEKKKKMIQDDDSCVEFTGSNLSSLPGYSCY